MEGKNGSDGDLENNDKPNEVYLLRCYLNIFVFFHSHMILLKTKKKNKNRARNFET